MAPELGCNIVLKTEDDHT